MDTLNQQQSPQPAVEQTPIPPKPSVDSKTLLIAVVVSIVIMIGLITYVLAARTKPTSQLPLSTTSPTLSQPSPTPVDETVNWKTYRNEKYGFEIMYPSDVNITIGNHVPPHGTDLVLPNDNFIESDVKIISTKSDIEIILSIFQKSMPNLEQYISNEVKREKEFNQANPLNSVSISYEKITINSIPTYRIYYTYPDSSQIPATRIYLQDSKHLYLFWYNDRRCSNIPCEYPDQSLISSKIISTFKFSN